MNTTIPDRWSTWTSRGSADPDGGGWRAGVIDRGGKSSAQKKLIGFDYVHSLAYDHSRLANFDILPDERGTTCAAFLLRAVEHFALVRRSHASSES